jgi:hypothetical protein
MITMVVDTHVRPRIPGRSPLRPSAARLCETATAAAIVPVRRLPVPASRGCFDPHLRRPQHVIIYRVPLTPDSTSPKLLWLCFRSNHGVRRGFDG